MYDDIRQHIREGKTRLAFQEIAELPLNRSQKDDLLLLESNYANYERSQLTESAEQRQLTLNRINRDILNLINRIEDSVQKESVAKAPEVVSPIAEPTQHIGKQAVSSSFPWKPVMGIMLLLLVSFAAYSFWPKNTKQNGVAKVEVEPSITEEPVGKAPSEQPSPSDFTTPNTNLQTIPAERLKVDPEVLKRNTEMIVNAFKGKQPKVGVVSFGSRIANTANPFKTNVIAKALDSKLSNLELLTPSFSSALSNSKLMEELKSGKYKSGPITEASTGVAKDLYSTGVSHLLLVLVDYSSRTERTYKFRMFELASGNFVINHQTKTFKQNDEQGPIDFMASKLNYWVKKQQ